MFRFQRPSTAPGSHSSDLMRLEVRPPALGRSTRAEPIGWRAWLGAAFADSSIAAPRRTQRAPQHASAPLAAVRAEFDAALADIGGTRAALVGDNIRRARSLRELWHLRADVYSVVATDCSEAEAQRRVQQLNRHFATRVPRAGDALP